MDVRNKFSTMRVVENWNMKVVEAPLLEIFKVRLNRALGNWI